MVYRSAWLLSLCWEVGYSRKKTDIWIPCIDDPIDDKKDNLEEDSRRRRDADVLEFEKVLKVFAQS